MIEDARPQSKEEKQQDHDDGYYTGQLQFREHGSSLG